MINDPMLVTLAATNSCPWNNALCCAAVECRFFAAVDNFLSDNTHNGICLFHIQLLLLLLSLLAVLNSIALVVI